MIFHAAEGVTALQVVGSAVSTLKTARDLVDGSKDHKLKQAMGDAYDALLDLKGRIVELDDENRDLKAKLAKKDSFTSPEPPYGYVYRITDTSKAHPLCPECLRKDGSEQYLDVKPFDDLWHRSCRLCRWDCIEPHKHPRPRYGS